MAIAEKILYGNVITMDDSNPLAEAVGIKNGRIIFVGSKDEAKEYYDQNTKIIDYGSNSIYPGFMESHCHGLLAGKRALGQIDLSDGRSYEDYQKIIGKFIDEHPGKAFYVAAGLIERDFTPTKEILDEINPQVPIMASTMDGHSVLLNSKALEILEIGKETVKKYEPGEIRADENGEPTGYVSEGPVMKIVRNIPESIEETVEQLLYWQDFAFKNGFTAAVEAGDTIFSKYQNQGYVTLEKEGKLKLRTYSYSLISENTPTPKEDVERVTKEILPLNSEHFKTVGLKVFLDGVVEAHTAWLLKDYDDQPGYYGLKRYTDRESMTNLIDYASKYNLGVHAHSVGDGSTRFMLDCIEEAEKRSKNMDQRNCIAHLQLVDKVDIPRFGQTKTIAITAPIWVPDEDAAIEQQEKYLGKKRCEECYPIKSFIDNGAIITFHSDYPVSFLFNAPMSVAYAVERRDLFFGNGYSRGLDQVISRKEAIEAMTKNVAYMVREEDNLGTIEVGKIANFSIFDKDFLKDDLTQVCNSSVVATVVDGEEVFRA